MCPEVRLVTTRCGVMAVPSGGSLLNKEIANETKEMATNRLAMASVAHHRVAALVLQLAERTPCPGVP